MRGKASLVYIASSRPTRDTHGDATIIIMMMMMLKAAEMLVSTRLPNIRI